MTHHEDAAKSADAPKARAPRLDLGFLGISIIYFAALLLTLALISSRCSGSEGAADDAGAEGAEGTTGAAVAEGDNAQTTLPDCSVAQYIIYNASDFNGIVYLHDADVRLSLRDTMKVRALGRKGSTPAVCQENGKTKIVISRDTK